MPKDIDKTIYIDGQFEDTQITPSAFCWRPYWSSRFESLWSLLRKFAYLNSTTHREIHRLFGRNLTKGYNEWNWFFRSDLRHFGSLDPSKLAIIFGLSYEDLVEATILKYVFNYEANTLTSEFLRFCPTCLHQGFHSSLHQLLFLTKCPVHGDRLENRCTDCLTHTIPYRLPSISSEDLYKCVHMLGGLNRHLTHSNRDDIRREAADRERALMIIAECLMKRVKLVTSEQSLSGWLPRKKETRYFTRHMKKLPAFWADVFMSKSAKGSFSILDTLGKHTQVWHQEDTCIVKTKIRHSPRVEFIIRRDTPEEVQDLELYRIYKSIRRHFIRGYLAPHRLCIAKLGRFIEWDISSIRCEGAICPAVNAVLLWGMFMEGVDEPHLLFRPPGKPRGWIEGRLHLDCDLPYPNLPDWVRRRIFAIDCVGSFHECILIAEALYRRSLHTFRLGHVMGRRRRYWLVEKSKSGKFTVHWWTSRPLSLLFGQNSSYFKSSKAKLFLSQDRIPRHITSIRPAK